MLDVVSLQAANANADTRIVATAINFMLITPRPPGTAATERESPASPLAGDLLTEVFDCFADFSLCVSYSLLRSAFCALHAAARFEVTIARQLTKFSFRRAFRLFRLTFNLILVLHIENS